MTSWLCSICSALTLYLAFPNKHFWVSLQKKEAIYHSSDMLCSAGWEELPIHPAHPVSCTAKDDYSTVPRKFHLGDVYKFVTFQKRS